MSSLARSPIVPMEIDSQAIAARGRRAFRSVSLAIQEAAA
jgi:hypothetical protein